MILGFGRSPGGGHGNPFQYSCLENPLGQRSLEGYSPWSRKELDMTKATKQYTQHSLILTLEKEIATRSNILAWEIPRTEEPGGLQSVQGVAKSRT